MPEGDTIRRLAAEIDGRFVGRRVVRDHVRHPTLALVSFAERTLTSTSSYGKHLFLRFDDDRSIHVHLLMQGRFRVGGSAPRGRSDETWRRRIEMWFENGPLIGIDIPLLHVVPTRDEARFVEHLGPDLCADDFDADRDLAIGEASMRAQPEQPLGGALLEQRHLAGFGNIYAVETPFICGVSPFAPVAGLGDLGGLLRVGAALIRTNAARGPQNTTGRRLADSDQWVLPGDRFECRVCRSRLARHGEQEVPWQRRTVRCPSCQPEPSDDIGSLIDLDRAERLLRLHPAHRVIPWP